MGDKIEGSMVFDLTTLLFLHRVAGNPGPKEYRLDKDGTFVFHPDVAGHEIEIVYDEVGPKVIKVNVRKRIRA